MLQINTVTRLDLGVKDENLARDLYIDMNAWYTDFPNGTISIWHKRSGDQTKYAAGGVTFDRETGILKWTPDAYDTFYVGRGLAEIRLTENDVIKKTRDVITEVARSLMLGSGETLQSGWQNFLNAVEQTRNEAQEAQSGAEAALEAAEEAVEAAENAQAQAENARDGAAAAAGMAEAAQGAAEGAVAMYPYIDAETGNWMVWDAAESEFVNTGISANGTPGAPGQPGADGRDGTSPEVTISNIQGGHRITVTDESGSRSFDVQDGEKGETGAPGVSPSVAVSEITGGHRLEVTDAGGTETFDVMDGAQGERGPAGPTGQTGAVPAIAVGTVETLNPGQSATVTRRAGSPDTAPVFDFGIPKGETGSVDNVYGSTLEMSPEDDTKVEDAIRAKTDLDVIAEEYDPDSPGYPAGSYCIYEGELYYTALGTSGGAWDSTKWTKETVAGELHGKVDVAPGTTNNFVAFAGNMKIKDSGYGPDDFLQEHQDISGKTDLDVIASPYDEEHSTTHYSHGDLVTRNGKMYYCITQTDGGTWDSTKWSETDVGAMLNQKVAIAQGTANSGKILAVSNMGFVEPQDPPDVNGRVFYGTCDTAAATRTKTTTISGYDEYKTGDVLFITFDNAQDYSSGDYSPFLNVNSLGNKGIKRTAASGGYKGMWQAGETVQLVYDGTEFIAIRSMAATTGYYGVTKLATAATSTDAGTALTPRALNYFAGRMITDIPVYDASSTYAVGDRVRYSWYVYECITAITTAEAWTAEHWQQLPAIQTQIDSITKNTKLINRNAATSHTFTIPSGTVHFVMAGGNNGNYYFIGFVNVSSTGTVSMSEIAKGSGMTVTTATNAMTISVGSTARVMNVYDICMSYTGNDSEFIS